MEPCYGYVTNNGRNMTLYQEPQLSQVYGYYRGTQPTEGGYPEWRDTDPGRFNWFHQCAVANPRHWVPGTGKHQYSLRDRLPVSMRRKTTKKVVKRGRPKKKGKRGKKMSRWVRRVKNVRKRGVVRRNGRSGRRKRGGARKNRRVRRKAVGMRKKKVGMIPRKKRASPNFATRSWRRQTRKSGRR